MSRIKEAMEYYEIFLVGISIDETVSLLESYGYYVTDIDREKDILLVSGFEPLEKYFDDIAISVDLNGEKLYILY